jgi:uncharacterized protein YndB with AHSA1/START domain
MGVVEFEVVRTVNAPIEQVFARLLDFAHYDDWMPRKGSIRKSSEQTSPGEPVVGTTYVDDTRFGKTPGEIAELERPHRLVFHWWDGREGKLNAEGWPGYTLEAQDEHTTIVRHHARLQTYRLYRLATPVLSRIALRERTATVDALQASFAST